MSIEEKAIESTERTMYAVNMWEKAPFHVKSVAGAYMVPVLQALKAQDVAIQSLVRRSINGKA